MYAAAIPQTSAPPLNTNGGVWRSNNGGGAWTQIVPSLSPSNANDRTEFAVTLLPNGKTCMYINDGNTGSPASRFFRSDDVATGFPVIVDLTTPQNANICTVSAGTTTLLLRPLATRTWSIWAAVLVQRVRKRV